MQRARDAGTLRMGTVDSFLCDRLGAGFATDPSTALAHPAPAHRHGRASTPASARRFGVPLEVLPEIRDTAGELGTLSHPSWPVELRLCGPDGRPAGGARGRGLRRARAGSRRPTAPASSCSPTSATRSRARRRPAAHGRLAHRRPDRVRARRRRLRGRRDARVDVQGARRRRGPGRARRARARGRRLRRARGCCPALAGIGAPWWRPNARAVLAGLDGGTTGRMVARAALEGIAWRVADVVAAIRETRRGRRACASTAASPTSRCCSSSRPTRSARRSRPPARTRRCSARRHSPRSARA